MIYMKHAVVSVRVVNIFPEPCDKSPKHQSVSLLFVGPSSFFAQLP